MIVQGMSFADGNFFEVYTQKGLYIFSQHYCKHTGLYTYDVNNLEGLTYSFCPIGCRLANGQVLDRELFKEMSAKARVWRKFKIKGRNNEYAIHA